MWLAAARSASWAALTGGVPSRRARLRNWPIARVISVVCIRGSGVAAPTGGCLIFHQTQVGQNVTQHGRTGVEVGYQRLGAAQL